jgi:hypothetical protein
MTEIIEIQQISDAFLGPLVEYLLDGLQSRVPEYRFATYVIVSALANKAKLSTDLVNNMCQRISESLSFAEPERAFLVLIYLLQTQGTPDFSTGNLKPFARQRDLVHWIKENQEKHYNLANFLAALLRFLGPRLKKKRYLALLQNLLQEVDLANVASAIMTELFTLFQAHSSEAATKKIVSQLLKVGLFP